ncbi:MAG: integrase core domain-containing protein [Egibacteraceae bacterium]
MEHFGRPHTPTDQGWIETLFGHIKGEWPHLDAIDDPAVLRAKLERVRAHYNTVRLHESIGYVTPDDEHEGRGPPSAKPDATATTSTRRAHQLPSNTQTAGAPQCGLRGWA